MDSYIDEEEYKKRRWAVKQKWFGIRTKIWWNPIEKKIKEGDWARYFNYIRRKTNC